MTARSFGRRLVVSKVRYSTSSRVVIRWSWSSLGFVCGSFYYCYLFGSPVLNKQEVRRENNKVKRCRSISNLAAFLVHLFFFLGVCTCMRVRFLILMHMSMFPF